MKNIVIAALTAGLLLSAAAPASAHCQIPCGIYDDELRVQLMEEHITTIEKSMTQIIALGKESPLNFNQVVRWVVNKEEHADKIQDIVTSYFMSQRIKPPAAADAETKAAYIQRLTLLHRIQVTAMLAKQSTDLAHVETLRSLVKEFRTAYFGDEAGHTH